MSNIGRLTIEPPLINTSCAWAGELHELEALYACSSTGAVTSRTATLDGFPENETNTVRDLTSWILALVLTLCTVCLLSRVRFVNQLLRVLSSPPFHVSYLDYWLVAIQPGLLEAVHHQHHVLKTCSPSRDGRSHTKNSH